MCSRRVLPATLLLAALRGSEDPGGGRRNPILFRQYGFLGLGFVLLGIKARNVKMEDPILRARRAECALLWQRGNKRQGAMDKVSGLRAI